MPASTWTARALDSIFFIIFTVLPTAPPFLGHFLVTASVSAYGQGSIERGPMADLSPHAPTRQRCRAPRRRLESTTRMEPWVGHIAIIHRAAAAAVCTGRTWAFRGGPGPSLIGKVGADLPSP